MIRRALSTATLLMAMAQPALAQTTFTFSDLSYDGGGSSIATNLSGFKPTNGFFCSVGDICSSYMDAGPPLGGNLTYSPDGFSVVATR